MQNTERRYDIDWIRVIAIALLMIYHCAIGFQPWGMFIGFITNQESLSSLWPAMMLLNVWRIPLLFFVSGMGVFLAFQKRNITQLLLERGKRIGIPLIFGSFCIVPIHEWIRQSFYKQSTYYAPGMSHLWFLGNILLYVLLLGLFFNYLKNKPNTGLARWLKKFFGSIGGIVLTFLLFVCETFVLDPKPFELYAFTLHGLVIGLLAFLLGFLFMYAGDPFWTLVREYYWAFLLLSIGLYINRYIQMPAQQPAYLLSIESNGWIFGMLGVASCFLNRSGKVISYLKAAAYPVYVMHMAFLFLGSKLIFPMTMAAERKYILLLIFSVGGSLLVYEILIRRIRLLGVLFGG
jgi:glucans biosynthesis protein C